MANPILLLGLGAAALLMFGGKKKAVSSGASSYEEPPPAPKSGPSGSTASKKVWRERQNALAYITGFGICACSPGKIDGIYGNKTKNALKAFQAYAGISQTGKWDNATNEAMKAALLKATQNIIVKPATTTGGGGGSGWGDAYAVCNVIVSPYDGGHSHDGIRTGNGDAERLLNDIRLRMGGPRSYRTESAWTWQSHSHDFTLSMDQRRRLSNGEDVFVSSKNSSDNAAANHVHQIQIRCGK